MVTPPQRMASTLLVLGAAKLAGVDAVYPSWWCPRCSGFAYGTESIPKVDKIVGPSNLRCYSKTPSVRQVDIDMIAGP